ncbi:universal stress protein [Opitutaceae bacterium TAV4]|uniref:universal stress protein n=1 Tax=Geminisphaera colitermitum TaxID=1148786 RepID=UPI000158D4C4|nr:universal stress protein [Geminisphaera colitermitum]RRJ95178.1 universal stress protein [Opitutaceae bacterium TAV4]RRJ99431.1 universal stress protein [Opitutaceae bacterium TAV3]RRJ99435.1 universal stress protein [Opitutaceae bacterium TAV3]
MPTILTCTDGSIYASSIYDHTAWAARRLKVPVRVLHMLEPVSTVSLTTDFTGIIGPDAQNQLAAELMALEAAQERVNRTRSDALLAAARDHLAKAGVTDVRAEVLPGELVDAITTYNGASGLVVMGKRGEHVDFAKGHLGSNLERVIRTSQEPVLVASRVFRPIGRVLFAWDGSSSAQKALNYILTRPLLQRLHFLLLTVGDADTARAAETGLARSRLAAAGFDVEARHVAGDVSDVIAATVEREAFNLLVMGAYGHSRIRQLFVGSTTSDMIRNVQIPVLLFRQ